MKSSMTNSFPHNFTTKRDGRKKKCLPVRFLAFLYTPNSLLLIIFPTLHSLGLFSALSCSTERHIACYSPSSLSPTLDLL